MTLKRKAILIGDVERAKYHPLTGFDREFQAILTEFVIDQTTDYDAFLADRLNSYELCICFTDRWIPMTDDQTAGLVSFVAQGGGLLLVHNGISIQARPELAQLAGGYFTGHPEQRILSYEPTSSDHPIASGLSGFSAQEEPYQFKLDELAKATVLLTFDLDGKSCPAAWARPFGRGRVVNLSPGHNLESMLIPAYRKLIRQSAIWLVERP
ncbi:MAG TPA: ThuA domain-containing protein [Acholeplasmatales bacterium]|nr:MAG: hypothetical protein A2Y16_00975 [Tenericutes bacterium GWF2_57_13]HAQ56424.1 ThuA domain-containing protein [Acholeplasmatales bacterium]